MYRREKNTKDVLYILRHLREEDRHEAIIQKGENYVEKCLKDIMESDGHFVLGCKRADNTPVCMGGCAGNKQEGIGVVWLLSTPEIVNYQTALLRNIKREIEKYEKEYWLMYNMLYEKNRLAKKWLKKLGFIFDKPAGLNLAKEFELFYKKRKTRGLRG